MYITRTQLFLLVKCLTQRTLHLLTQLYPAILHRLRVLFLQLALELGICKDPHCANTLFEEGEFVDDGPEFVELAICLLEDLCQWVFLVLLDHLYHVVPQSMQSLLRFASVQ